MTAAAETRQHTVEIIRPIANAPILTARGPKEISIVAGAKIIIDGKTYEFNTEHPVEYFDESLVPGRDYTVTIDLAGRVLCDRAEKNPNLGAYFAGFHFAPASWGGDNAPAINPSSIWDLDFRPACPDPRGMTLVEVGGCRIWVDIYLLGVDHVMDGTSRYGATIADGRDLPFRPDGEGKCRKLDYPTAVEIYAHHGKRLLTAEEFFAAAYGVKERCSRTDEPTVTGTLEDQAHRFISKAGLFDATGTMWQWGTDGHPDDPRPSIFGGSWLNGSDAGSRFAALDCWPENSSVLISARGACDPLHPA